jgi:hypothetical protein
VIARVFYQSTMREFIEELARANTTNTRGTELLAIWEQTGRSAPRLIATQTMDVTVGPPTGAGGAGGGAGAGGGGAGGSEGAAGSAGSSGSGCGCTLASPCDGGSTPMLMLTAIVIAFRKRRPVGAGAQRRGALK